jgi:hypothetical protein
MVLFYKSKIGVIASGFIGPGRAAQSPGLFSNVDKPIFSRKVTDLVAVSDDNAVKPSELRSFGITGPLLHSLCRRYSAKTAEAIRFTLEARQSS